MTVTASGLNDYKSSLSLLLDPTMICLFDEGNTKPFGYTNQSIISN